tara:strand:+ start:1349 stop:1906 length:558 start_codon:yes stop_codon:yes gene_type:complete
MARRKRSRSGLSYFGKKVETQEIRFDKNVFVEKLAKKTIGGKTVGKTTQVTRFGGDILHEIFTGDVENVGDASVSISANDLFLNNFFTASPSTSRTFQLPTEDDVLAAFSSVAVLDFTTLQAHRFTIINTGSSTIEVVASDTVTNKSAGGGGTVLNGNMIISSNTSGTFTYIRDGAFIDVIRILE